MEQTRLSLLLPLLPNTIRRRQKSRKTTPIKSNVNSKIIGVLLVALLATAISLGGSHAFASDAEDKTKAADTLSNKP